MRYLPPPLSLSLSLSLFPVFGALHHSSSVTSTVQTLSKYTPEHLSNKDTLTSLVDTLQLLYLLLRRMRGVVSEAMVMCASSPEKVEILDPPEACVPGDRVTFQGYTGVRI